MVPYAIPCRKSPAVGDRSTPTCFLARRKKRPRTPIALDVHIAQAEDGWSFDDLLDDGGEITGVDHDRFPRFGSGGLGPGASVVIDCS